MMEQNLWHPDEWRGVRFPVQGQMRIDGFRFDTNDNTMRLGNITVRSEVWPQWLQIAAIELTAAKATRETNPGIDGGEEFDRAILAEYCHSMLSISAVAFTFEAFTNSVTAQCPTAVGGNYQRQAASARFHQIWVRAFRLSNVNSANTKKTLEQAFALRNGAVHASAEFVEPVNHATYPVALERRFLIYTVENADILYRLAIDALGHLLARPRGEDSGWITWCSAMSERLRLMEMPLLNLPTKPPAPDCSRNRTPPPRGTAYGTGLA